MTMVSQAERAHTSDKSLSICLINPRSNPSYWTFDYGQQFFNLGRKKQYSTANGALVGVAALVPEEHKVVIVDENIESLDFGWLKDFDVIGVTGMIVQAQRMLEILKELQSLPATIVVGGPFVTVSEDTFTELSDVRFIGEAEETWPLFLRTLASGEPTNSRYEQAEKTDMSTVPLPRFDLYPNDVPFLSSQQLLQNQLRPDKPFHHQSQSTPGLKFGLLRSAGKRDKGEVSPVDPPEVSLAVGWIHTLPV